VNALDIALVVIVGLSTLVGLWRGFVREVLGFISVLASIVIAYVAAPRVVAALGSRGGAVTDVVAVVVLFLVAMVLFATLGSLLTRFLDATKLRGIDRLFGGVFGFARAAALTSVALALLILILDPTDPLLQRSKVLRAGAPAVRWVGEHFPIERARTSFRERWMVVTRGGAGRITADTLHSPGAGSPV
jgi:membrane protein required for colicin V production